MSTWQQKENLIREKRIIDATRKNYLGPTGKFGAIVKVYGVPIIRQSHGSDSNYLTEDDFTYEEYERTQSGQNGPLVFRDEIPEFDDDSPMMEGLMFDGLNRGLHLEIKHWFETNKISVHYKGYIVYQEDLGELECFVPNKEWEDHIAKLYKSAKPRVGEMKKDEKEAYLKKVESKKASFFERLKRLWGF